MGKEYHYRCKLCDATVMVPQRVYQLMVERGESLPERCAKHRLEHQRDVRSIKSPYFEPARRPPTAFSRFDYFQSLYTSHGDRQRREVEVAPNPGGMRVRITDDHIRTLFNIFRDNQVVILSSPTGTGKSTHVLYRLVEAPDPEMREFVANLTRQGQIVQTQPLSSAVERNPQTIAERLLGDSEVGEFSTLGLRHAGRQDYGPHNLAVVVTDGSLRNWIRDGQVGRYSLINIDEAHKRTVNIDSLLTLLRAKLPLYPHLKLLISSATIAAEEFRTAFASAGLQVAVFDLAETLAEQIDYSVHFWDGVVEGRCDCWTCRRKNGDSWQPWFAQRSPADTELPQVVSEIVMTILRDTSTGGILVFLPGQARIEDAAELIEEKKLSIDPRNEIPVIPIYRKIGEKEVIRRFNQLGKKRRVILATDIAETAHTLEDVLYVIDSGYIRQHRWDPLSETSSLPVVRHSQAGCKQRWGRVGRVKRGYVYALYTKDEFDMFDEQTEPEVRRSNLEEYVLTLRSAGMMQSVPVIGASEGEGPLKTELARATRALETTGLLNREGDITEKGLEFFRVPLGAFEKALLDSADEQNCLLEMLTVLMMMQSREGEIRTGAGLYSRTGGLLVWDSRWSAATKLRVHRAQQSLFFGCDDDLDFVLSLASQFEEAENAGIGREWSAFYFVNYDNLKTVCERRDEVLDIYRARTKDQESRRLELGLIARARSALVVLLESTKLISLSQAGNSLEFTQKAGSQNGIISPNCVGSWQAGDKAVLLAATRTKAIIGGQLAVGTVGSFLVRPLFQRIDNARACALTRAYPTGAKVMIAEDGVFRVVGRTTSPPSIDVSYRDEMTFGGLSEDAARRKILGKFSWPAPASVGSLSMPALWDASSQPGGTGEALMSRVEGLGDGLTAVVTSVDAQRLGYQDIRGKREGDTLEATVVEVFRDPDYYGRGGWALVKTRQGFEIPVELAALSMDFNGFGLERLVGTTMNLRVDEVRCGVPRLSQFDALASDLRSLAVRLGQEPLIRATGFIEHVDPQRSEVFVSVLRPGNLIHVFQIDKVGIAGIIDNLGIGESVEIALGLSRRREVFQSYYSPRPHELQSLPRKAGWRFDKKHARLVIPLGLSANDLEGWTANRDTKQRVLRTSWRYRFNASIVGRAAYDDIKVGQEVFGIVVELERGTVGSLKRIWVRVPVGAAFLRGSVASSDFAAAVAPATSSPLEPSLGQKLRLVVSHVDSSAWQVQLREPSHDDTVSQLPV